MTDRIKEEIELIRKSYELDFHSVGNNHWLKIKEYILPIDMGWNNEVIDICILIPQNYPASAPYGIYVPSDLRINSQLPASNYQEIAGNQPPFEGSWGLISWSVDGSWLPKANIIEGANLLNVIHSYSDRFKMGSV